jgi:hypothetical protein
MESQRLHPLYEDREKREKRKKIKQKKREKKEKNKKCGWDKTEVHFLKPITVR